MLQLRIEFRDFYKRKCFTKASPIRGHKERKEEKMKKEEVTGKEVKALHLLRKYGPRRTWKKTVVPLSREGKQELKLDDIPANEKIVFWLAGGATIVFWPTFKVSLNRHIVRPHEMVHIPQMSGQHNLTVCGIPYIIRIA